MTAPTTGRRRTPNLLIVAAARDMAPYVTILQELAGTPRVIFTEMDLAVAYAILYQGCRNKEIARAFRVTPRTTRYYTNRLIGTCHCRSRIELITHFWRRLTGEHDRMGDVCNALGPRATRGHAIVMLMTEYLLEAA